MDGRITDLAMSSPDFLEVVSFDPLVIRTTDKLSIGTVTTGAPGDPAVATVTGEPPSQILNLTLPQGATGP